MNALSRLLTIALFAGLWSAALAQSPPSHDTLQCVPFARALSSVSIYGDAWRWWDKAAGRFDRGQIPRAGAVLSFRPNIRMPLGHVAVVTRVVGAREIEIDHANWAAPSAISRGVEVIDVSPGNDWTEVRVELGRSDYFGSLYATDGFIYGRPIDIVPQIINVAEALRAGNPYVMPMGVLPYDALYRQPLVLNAGESAPPVIARSECDEPIQGRTSGACRAALDCRASLTMTCHAAKGRLAMTNQSARLPGTTAGPHAPQVIDVAEFLRTHFHPLPIVIQGRAHPRNGARSLF